MESSYVNTSSIRNKRHCWKRSTKSKRRCIFGTVATRSGWEMVGRFHGIAIPTCGTFKISCLMVNTPYEKRFGEPFKGPIIPFWFIRWVSPFLCTWNIPWIRSVRGRNLEGWYNGCRHWRAGNDGRIRNLLYKTQRKGSNISKRKWKTHFSSRRWDESNFSEGDQELRTPTLIREHPIGGEGHVDFLGESEGSPPPLPQESLPDAGWSKKWLLVHDRKLHIPPSRWTQSQTLLAERRIISYSTAKNRRYWKLRIQTWMLCEKAASMDYWNIDGSIDLSDSWTGFTQFSLLEEKPSDGYVWSGGETDKKAVSIQARSFMARTLERDVKER